MPTQQGIAAANAQTTDEAWLMLLAIHHPSFTNPIRVARDKKDVVHGGNTYLAFPFDVKLPDDGQDSRAVGRIEIDDIGEFDNHAVSGGPKETIGDIIKAMAVGENATVDLTVVLGNNPEQIERGPMTFTLRNVHGDGLTVTGDLHFEDIMNEPFPCDSMPA